MGSSSLNNRARARRETRRHGGRRAQNDGARRACVDHAIIKDGTKQRLWHGARQTGSATACTIGKIMGAGDDDSDDANHLADSSAKDAIFERLRALVRDARASRSCLVDTRQFFVAEIHGCYRPAWRTFAMAAAVTAAACRGFIGTRIPSGTRIVSAIAFHNPLAPQTDATTHLSALGAHSALTFDRLVVLLSWPSRSHDSDDLYWVAASLGSGPGDPNGRDGVRCSDGGCDDGECDIGGDDNGDVHCRAYSRPTSGLYGAVLQQAARITGESLHEAVSTLVADPVFRKHHTIQRHSHMLTVGWQYNVHDPTLAESVMPCPDGTLKRACVHTADHSCAECDAVWANSEDLLRCARATTRRVALRHVVRQAVADGIAIEATARAKAIPKAPPIPRRAVAVGVAVATTTTKTTEPVVTATTAKDDARAEAPSGPARPRCGRALCPSRAGRVDTSTCASVRVRCTAGCRVIFHRACWRAVADRTLARGDESPCVTPDCWGLMASVVSLAPHQSDDATGRDARTKHVEWQTTTSHGLDKHVRQQPSGTAPAIACRDRLDDVYIEREPQAPPPGTVDVENDDVAARTVDTADADDPSSVAVDDAHEPAEPPVSLDVAARAYRKDRQRTEPALCAKKAKRTRTRTQKRQRVRARQKMGLDDLPAPVPWHGCDDQWPSFFVGDAAAAPPLPGAQTDADRPARPLTVWRFGTWYPSAARPS